MACPPVSGIRQAPTPRDGHVLLVVVEGVLSLELEAKDVTISNTCHLFDSAQVHAFTNPSGAPCGLCGAPSADCDATPCSFPASRSRQQRPQRGFQLLLAPTGEGAGPVAAFQQLLQVLA